MRLLKTLFLAAFIAAAASAAEVTPLWKNKIEATSFQDTVGPACVNDDQAFFYFKTTHGHNITAVSVTTGQQQWNTALHSDLSLVPMPSCSNSLVAIAHGSWVETLNPTTGSFLGQAQVGADETAIASVIDGSGNVIASTDKATRCFAPNGTVLWKSHIAPVPGTINRLAFTSGHVLFNAKIDTTYTIVALRMYDGLLSWSAALPGTKNGQRVTVSDVRATGDLGGLLLVSFTLEGSNHNRIAGLNIVDHGYWIWDISPDFFTNLATTVLSYSKGLFTVATANGDTGFEVQVINASTGVVVSKTGPYAGFDANHPSRLPINPAIVKGTVVFSSINRIHAVDALTGDEMWTYSRFYSGVNWFALTKNKKHGVVLGAISEAYNTVSLVAFNVTA